MPDLPLTEIALGVVHVARLLGVSFAALWFSLVVHELGHAAAAWLLGVRLWGIRLGDGPVLLERKLGGIRWRIAPVPLRGSVQLLDADAGSIGYRDLDTSRWRFRWGPASWRAPAISAAGPAANLLAGLLLVHWWPASATSPVLHQVVFYAILTSLAGWLNLLPIGPSDGRRIVRQLAAFRVAATA